MKKYLIILMLVLLSGISDTQTQKPAEKRFEVSVGVQCDDENTKAFIESHIKRELRALGDVDIQEFNRITNDFEIVIIALEPSYKSTGRKAGLIAISYTFINYFDDNAIKDYFDDIDDDAIKNIKNTLNKYDLIILKSKLNRTLNTRIDFGLSTGSTDALDERCKKIIVKFDTDLLEPERQKR